MTIEYPYSLAQLAQTLSALEGERRNPNTKRNAIKAIELAAVGIGLTAADVFDAADGLLSGRLSATDWRAQLRDGVGTAKFVAEALPVEPAADDAGPAAEPVADDGGSEPATETGVVNGSGDEPADSFPMPNAGPLTATLQRRRATRTGSKQALLIAMLRRDEGATIEQIVEATGWQRHTCRGAISGTLKKKLGLAVISGKIDGRRVYRIGD